MTTYSENQTFTGENCRLVVTASKIKLAEKSERNICNYPFMYRNEKLGFECFMDLSKLTMMFYTGRKKKASKHVRFETIGRLKEYIKRILTNLQTDFDRKEADRQKQAVLKASDFYQVGDIVYNSWGWEQTNIEFYQVTEVKNKSIIVKEILQELIPTKGYSSMAGETIGKKDQFRENGSTYELRLRSKSYFNVDHLLTGGESYYHFSKWNGQPKYVSWYA